MRLSYNVGGGDKTFRIVLGIVLAIVAIFVESTAWTVILLAAAAIALVTAFVGYCPLNALFGVNTRKTKAA